jgi:hypothetical protein
MAGKFVPMWFSIFYDYELRSNETQKLFLNHTTNKSDKHKILFCVFNEILRKNLDHKFVININTYFISNHFSLVTNKDSTIGKRYSSSIYHEFLPVTQDNLP